MVEAFAQVRGQHIDAAAQLQQRILLRSGGERAHSGADRLLLRPTARLRPRLEPIELGVFKVHLIWSSHDTRSYWLMMIMSIQA